MRVIALAHASTLATSLMRLKSGMYAPFLFMSLIVWDIGMKKIQERSKTSI